MNSMGPTLPSSHAWDCTVSDVGREKHSLFKDFHIVLSKRSDCKLATARAVVLNQSSEVVTNAKGLVLIFYMKKKGKKKPSRCLHFK